MGYDMRRSFLFSILFVAVLISCNFKAFRYEGDGRFTDHGPSTGNNRYHLFLGQLDICKKSKHVFTVGDLPDEPLLLYLAFKPENGNSVKLLSMLSNLMIRITVSEKQTGKKIFEYDGVLYKDGHKNGQYFREGLQPGEIYDSTGQKLLGLNVDYSFDEKLEFCNIKTPFYDDFHRIIEVEITVPCCNNNCNMADVIIQGGGWE